MKEIYTNQELELPPLYTSTVLLSVHAVTNVQFPLNVVWQHLQYGPDSVNVHPVEQLRCSTAACQRLLLKVRGERP
jgi:hypothetical protein